MKNNLGEMISDLINRLCNCMNISTVNIFGKEFPLKLYSSIEIWNNDFSISGYRNCLMLVVGDIEDFCVDDGKRIRQKALEADACIYLCNRVPDTLTECKSRVIEIKNPDYRLIILQGEIFNPQKIVVPKDFKVLAIMHVYNEADIIERTLNYLLDQGIDIYVLDNWSDDGTCEIIKKMKDENPKRIFLESFPEEGSTNQFELYFQLQKTEEISRKCEYDWYIHYDADEMRISPWEGFSLREAIYVVDQMGYNIIENTVVNFKLTDAEQPDIFMKDVWFDFGRKKTHYEQFKTWKNSASVELAKSGGHRAVIKEPRVFPLKILNRHYPFRSLEQARKKVLKDRIPRFESEKKKLGWHGHYDKYAKGDNFICNKNGLLKWKSNTCEELWILLFTGTGIDREVDEVIYDLPDALHETLKSGESYVIYGAGKYGKSIYRLLSPSYHIASWVDKNYNELPRYYAVSIGSPQMLNSVEFDKLIIAIDYPEVAEIVRNELKGVGINPSKTVWMRWSEILKVTSDDKDSR